MDKSKTPITWKTSDRRTKPSENVGLLGSSSAFILGTFGLVAFKVILRSFGALAIFRNFGLMIRDRI